MLLVLLESGLWVGRTSRSVLRPKPSADAALDLKLRIEGSSGSPIGFGVKGCGEGMSTKLYCRKCRWFGEGQVSEGDGRRLICARHA